jgi:hypothetical protein
MAQPLNQDRQRQSQQHEMTVFFLGLQCQYHPEECGVSIEAVPDRSSPDSFIPSETWIF